MKKLCLLAVLVGVLGRSAVGNLPFALDDYMDDTLREVEIPEAVAMTACLGSSDTANSLDAAYKKCIDMDLNTFAADEAIDADDDGLSEAYEEMEACFYAEMKWYSGSDLDVAEIKKQMSGLDEGIKKEFESKLDECNTWAGTNRRMKRSLDSEGAEGISGLLARSRREADPAKKKGKKGKNGAKRGKRGRKGKKNGARRGKRGRKGKKRKGNKGKKRGRKGKKGKGKGTRKSKKGKGKKNRRNGKGKGKGKSGRKGKGKKRSGKK